MLIISIRTDKPEAEIGLFADREKLSYEVWQAHRELATTIHQKISEMLVMQGKDWHDIEGIVAYKGPGSFTGLRIGLSVANALAYALQVPIVSQESSDWLERGIAALSDGKDEKIALPHYSTPAHITTPTH